MLIVIDLPVDKDNVARSFVGDGELQGTGYRHEREITCLAWNPNGNYFATTNIDGQTCVWDISVVPIKLKNSWDHHAPHKAYHVDWLTNEIFATCSEDNTIALCSVNSVDRLTVLSKHRDRVLVCKFSPKLQAADKLSPTTKRLLASGSDDHTVRIWDMQGVEDEGAKVFTNGRDQSVSII
jgi:transducin (beta)-like 1